MSQRNSSYARKPNDFYATPEWVTEALIPYVDLYPHSTVLEAAAGSGRMASVLARHWDTVRNDIEKYDDLTEIGDFLLMPTLQAEVSLIDAVITNPPYNLAQEFCEHALRVMESRQGKVAMLLRTDFDHAKSRTHLFRDCPAFSKKLVLMKRIVWFVEDNGKPKASPSFNHAWYIWDWKHEGPATIAYGP